MRASLRPIPALLMASCLLAAPCIARPEEPEPAASRIAGNPPLALADADWQGMLGWKLDLLLDDARVLSGKLRSYDDAAILLIDHEGRRVAVPRAHIIDARLAGSVQWPRNRSDHEAAAQNAAAVPPAATGVGYPTRFEAKRDNKFTVTLEQGESCETPCELSVSPGRHRLKIEGDASFEQTIDFPAAPGVVRIDKRHAGYTALAVTSIVVGGAAIIGGFLVIGLGGINNTPPGPQVGHAGDSLVAIGAGIAVAGAAVAAVGASVGFSQQGRKRATLETGEPRPRETAPLQLTSFGVAPTRGGAMLGAMFAF